LATKQAFMRYSLVVSALFNFEFLFVNLQ